MGYSLLGHKKSDMTEHMHTHTHTHTHIYKFTRRVTSATQRTRTIKDFGSSGKL